MEKRWRVSIVMLLGIIMTVFLAACENRQPVSPAVTEVPVVVTTPEPTPTTAVCTPLPDDMNIDIQFESDLHGKIIVTGLLPSDRPTVLLTGDSSTGNWRYDFQLANAVGDNGRFQDTFDFRSWPSIEGYTFQGKLIHQRGVACFPIDLPESDDSYPTGQIPNGRLDTPESGTPPSPTIQPTTKEAIIARLETLQARHEETLRDYDGWLYTQHTEFFPTDFRGNPEPVNFLWLADTWMWEYWHEVIDGEVNRQIIHVSDEADGVWSKQLIADDWTAFVLPVERDDERVVPLDMHLFAAHTISGPYWLLQWLEIWRSADLEAWEENNRYHIVHQYQEAEPTEMVGFPASVTEMRQHYMFDTESGRLLQESREALLTTGEWISAGEVTYTQFDLLSQLPDDVAYTLAEGTTLIHNAATIDEP